MGRTALQRFFPIEIIRILGSLVTISLRLHYFRGDESLSGESITELLTRAFILTDCLCDDILSPFDGSCHIFYVAFDKPLCGAFRIAFALEQEYLGEWLQSLFASHLGTCATLGFIGQIDIFQLCRIPTVVDAFLQLWCQFP